MKPKKIVKKSNGKSLTAEEARDLCRKLRVQVGTLSVEYKSVYGYPTAALAKSSILQSVYNAYPGYTFAHIGTVNDGDEGFKIFAIAIYKLPQDFSSRCQEYTVIG